MKHLRVKQSKGLSIVGLITGIVLFIFAIFFAIPDGGLFGLAWMAITLIAIIICALNLFTERGVALGEIEINDQQDMATELSFDERLRKVEQLYKDGLLNEQEYKAKRRELLNKKW